MLGKLVCYFKKQHVLEWPFFEPNGTISRRCTRCKAKIIFGEPDTINEEDFEMVNQKHVNDYYALKKYDEYRRLKNGRK